MGRGKGREEKGENKYVFFNFLLAFNSYVYEVIFLCFLAENKYLYFCS